MVASYKSGVSDRVYPTRAALLDDLVAITRDEIVSGSSAPACSYIQFDAPYYSHYLDARQRERMRAEGVDPDAELEQAIAGDNAAFAGLPPHRDDVRAPRLPRQQPEPLVHGGRLRRDRRAVVRHAGRRHVPARIRRRAVGRIRTVAVGADREERGPGARHDETPALESVDALCRRVDEAARYVPLEHLAISPQCGFASIASGNLLSADDQWRKLQLVADTARRVWGS